MGRRNKSFLFPAGRRASSLALVAGAFLLALAVPLRAVEIKVTGLGWLGNRTATERLKLLLGETRGPTVDANAIEDAALVLISSLTEDGYLDPTLTVEVMRADGHVEQFPLDARLAHPLPRPLTATAATLHFERGHRFALTAVTFEGLTAIGEKDARAFFIGEGLLIPLASERIYSPSRLQRALGNLEEALRQEGYAEAAVTLGEVKIDRRTGEVRAAIRVHQGLLWQVKELKFEVTDGSAAPDIPAIRLGQFWTSLWRQNTATLIRRWYYARGHSDVQVALTPRAGVVPAGARPVTVIARVTPGPVVHVGEIKFKGNEHTREDTLRALVHIKTGDLLNPVRLDNAQARISQLGVFKSVNLEYQPPDGPVRDVLYDLDESQRQELYLLGGYGSYDEFRGGVEWDAHNLFGRGHTSSLKVIEAVKSSQADYVYNVPELFGSATNGSARLFGLRRQELSFEREEYGANVALLWPVKIFGFSVTTGYTFKHLRAANDTLATQSTDVHDTDVASLDLGLVRDRRDNPLTPHKGYKLQALVEAANRALGGQVVYQQVVLSGSYHTAWGHGRWIHLGLAHGFVTTVGASDDSDLPVNVRFFPGGDGSIRGYRKGAAAPRDAAGNFIGAKSYVQGNAEIEQALTSKWSAVIFVDALGSTAELSQYPFNDVLYATGLGIRYQTLIGPIRLEYGHNLNPRPRDPPGTLLLSVGYPF